MDNSRPVAAIQDVYMEVLGRARSSAPRSAFKALHSARVIDDDGKDDFRMRAGPMARLGDLPRLAARAHHSQPAGLAPGSTCT